MSDERLTSMTVTFYGGAPRKSEQDPARVAFIEGERKGEFIELARPRTWFGRIEDNEVRLAGDGVSKRHFLIDVHDDGQCYLVDHQSRNGTLVNGQPVRPNQPFALTHGDAISIVGHEMLFLHNQRTVSKVYAEEIEIDRDRARREAEQLLEGERDLLELVRGRRRRG